jgi:hypothetical protein
MSCSDDNVYQGYPIDLYWDCPASSVGSVVGIACLNFKLVMPLKLLILNKIFILVYGITNLIRILQMGPRLIVIRITMFCEHSRYN